MILYLQVVMPINFIIRETLLEDTGQKLCFSALSIRQKGVTQMSKTQKATQSSEKELVAEIRKLAQTQGLNHVFTTFLEIMATSFSAETDPYLSQERNRRYEELLTGMEPKDVSSYARMCALMALAVHESWDAPYDILGSIYHELQLNNKWNGQFFSPDNICRMIAMIVDPTDEEKVKQNETVTINEPACGSGVMILGTVWAMKQKHFDYQHKTLFIAQDIDIRCVWMAYIQLSLYQIPAVVIHGNTLTLEEWSRWYTPYAVALRKAGQEVVKREESEEMRAL